MSGPSSPTRTPRPAFQGKGTLGPEAVYVRRPADEQLRDKLRQGEYCHVLAPRQVGKSSLCRRTVQTLSQEGYTCVVAELTKLGTPENVGSFYRGLASLLAEGLSRPADEPEEFFDRSPHKTPQFLFARYLSEVLLPAVPGPLLIFLDEVDKILSFPFATDDFFVLVREFYNDRSAKPELKRLVFCLIGVFAIYDLIHSPDVTPYNIGTAIELTDFTLSEAQELAVAFADFLGDRRAAIAEIHAWTHGHPYMTHQLCQLLEQRELGDENFRKLSLREQVAVLVQEHFLSRADENLDYAEKRFARQTPGVSLQEKISLYRAIRFSDALRVDTLSRVHSELLLAGMVSEQRRKDGTRVLRVRNRVFAARFDGPWIAERTQGSQLAEALLRWLQAERDPRYLLAGSELANALSFAQHNETTQSEEAFLRASQDAQRQAELKKTRQRFTLGAVLVVTVVGFYALRQKNIASVAQEKARYNDELQNKNTELTRIRDELARDKVLLQRLAEERANLLSRSNELNAGLELQKQELQARQEQLEIEQNKLQAAIRQKDGALRAEAAALRQVQTTSDKLLAATKREAELRAREELVRERLTKQIEDATRALSELKQGRYPEALFLTLRSLAASLADQQRPPPSVREAVQAVLAERDRDDALRLLGHTRPLLTAQMTPDGQTLVSADRGGAVLLWESPFDGDSLAAEQPLARRVAGAPSAIRAALLSPDGAWVALVGDEGLRVAATKEGPATAYAVGSAAVQRVVFSIAGQRLAALSRDGSLHLFKLGEPRPRQTLRTASAASASLAFSPDGGELQLASSDGKLHRWETAKGQPLPDLSLLPGPTRWVSVSQQPGRIAWAGEHGPICLSTLPLADRGCTELWAQPTSDDVASLPSLTRGLLLQTGQYAAGYQNGELSIWGRPKGPLHLPGENKPAHAGPITGLASTAQGRVLATAAADGAVRFWDLTEPDSDPQAIYAYQPKVGPLHSLSFTGDGDFVLAAGPQGAVLFAARSSWQRLLQLGCGWLKQLDEPGWAKACPARSPRQR